MKVRKTTTRTRLYAFFSLALFALSGCANDGIKPERPSLAQQDIPPKYEVRAKVQHYSLSAMPLTGEISSGQRQNLDGFLATLAVGNPQALHVRITGVSALDARNQLVRILVADGLEPSKIEFMPASLNSAAYYRSTGTSNGLVKVDIVAEIYSVVPPSCPRLSRVRIAGNDNGVDSNWGCSTVSVFEQMVADPRDLVHGESGGTADSEVTSGAIDRMRKDKLKPLQDTGGVTLNAAGGS